MRPLSRSARAALSMTSLALVALVLSTLGVTPTPTAGAATPCGTTRIAKPAGGYWQCTFSDEFSGTKLDTTKWTVQTTAASGFHNGPECFVDNKANVSVSGGYLNLTVRKVAPFVCASSTGNYASSYTSGMVSTYAKFAQAYGRFEVSAKFPAATVAGLQEAIWLWPTTMSYGAWPTSGEIDIAEHYSYNPRLVVPYVHYTPRAVDTNVTNFNCVVGNVSQSHTYLLEWTPAMIQVSYDNKVCITDVWNPASPLTRPQPFDKPFMIALTQALGIGVNAPTSATKLPAVTKVNYVHVWS